MIKLEDITKIYKMGENEVHALDGVSLHIRPHEFVSVIGPSGSGKSTLMNIIGCLDVATSGKYEVDGIDASEMTDNQLADLRNKKIGFIFQQYNLLAKLSALENVELPLIYRGIPAVKRQEMAMAALEKVGLADKAMHKPTELSGGQQQRVSVARALCGNPSLILADEPTGALDSKSGAEIMQMIHDLHKDGNTIVIITHDLNIAKQAERIITIRDGKITSDIDNSKDMADSSNVKASDICDDENGKTADFDGKGGVGI
ncbi:MAG: ABC transporter ATP-binding protein [Clostridia bacterium]|nr:ABC transporter ATP-binding protein [Clostridia bacterium]